MMDLLGTVKTLNLPDWWICAGFVRSKIWDVIHQFSKRTPLPDIDVIYFDSSNTDELEEKKIERKLKSLIPNIPWSVKNQARMHVLNNMAPYVSSVDGVANGCDSLNKGYCFSWNKRGAGKLNKRVYNILFEKRQNMFEVI